MMNCGDFGGRKDNGEPCGRVAGWGTENETGPCKHHRDAVAVEQALESNETANRVQDAIQDAEPMGWAGRPASDFVNPGVTLRTNPFQRKKDKVAIVGFTDHRVQALELDDSWEIWGLNELYRYMPVGRFDRWFEIHDREYLAKEEDGRKHLEDLKDLDIPIYMQRCWEDIPASVYFPREMLIQVLQSEYWTNCPAWMIGLAIAMGYSAIHVYGVDMANDEEYAYQRPCCEHWLGVARGMGIDVKVPPTSDLLKCFGHYGYEDMGNELAAKMNEREQYLHKQDNQKLQLIRELEFQYEYQRPDVFKQVARLEGRLDEARVADAPEERIEAIEQELSDARLRLARLDHEYETKHEALTLQRAQCVGSISDVGYWKRSWLVKANGAGGAIPDRSQDPKTGIEAAKDDSGPPTETVNLQPQEMAA